MSKRKTLVLVAGVILLLGVGIQGLAVYIGDPDWLLPAVDSYPYLLTERTSTIAYITDQDYFTMTLQGGVSYKITLSVPWWADFDIAVFDEDVNLVAISQNGEGENEVVYITPAWTGPFYIVVYTYDGDTGSYTMQVWY